MPLFVLAGSSSFVFEQTLEEFRLSEDRNREELENRDHLDFYLNQVRPTIAQHISQPKSIEYQEKLNAINRNITQHINEALQAPLMTLERRQLLTELQKSWDAVYANVNQQNTEQTNTLQSPNASIQISDSDRQKIYQDLEKTLEINSKIRIYLAAFQIEDNLTRAQNIQKQAHFLISAITWVGVIIALLSAIILSRSVLSSMRRLIEGVEKLSEGELDKRIEWNNSDEFGRIANAINDMAEKLAHSQQALIEIATLDGLTGVFNRREFNRLLTIEIERSRRNSNPVSMVMVDIDHFKSINDTYGHQSGDDALQWVSAILKGAIRPGDIVARYGGEEFALILPNTNGEDAGIVAERIRKTMESELVPIQKGMTISVTASLGCATYPYVGDSEELLMSAADKALYRAKETGRNRVCHAQIDLDFSKSDQRTEQSALT